MNRTAPSQRHARVHPLLWQISLACFIVAALIGFLYRLGMVGALPASLRLGLDNIRHAHSHLMFFGWAQAWGGMWIFQVLLAVALLPALAMGMQWIAIITSQKETS